LFLNDESLGRKKRGQYEYRFRWDSVLYKPGELRVVTYKNGNLWAADTVKTAGDAAKLQLVADRNNIKADGKDLAFITVSVLDAKGITVPIAENNIQFEVSGPGQIVATDNGDPTDLTSFISHQRKAFAGLALVIVSAKAGTPGTIKITARSAGLTIAQLAINSK